MPLRQRNKRPRNLMSMTESGGTFFPKAREVYLGPVYLAAGGMWHQWRGRWWPDGLHVWIGNRGVHLFWAKGHGKRINWDRAT